MKYAQTQWKKGRVFHHTSDEKIARFLTLTEMMQNTCMVFIIEVMKQTCVFLIMYVMKLTRVIFIKNALTFIALLT